MFYSKYLTYKKKYLQLKLKQNGGQPNDYNKCIISKITNINPSKYTFYKPQQTENIVLQKLLPINVKKITPNQNIRICDQLESKPIPKYKNTINIEYEFRTYPIHFKTSKIETFAQLLIELKFMLNYENIYITNQKVNTKEDLYHNSLKNKIIPNRNYYLYTEYQNKIKINDQTNLNIFDPETVYNYTYYIFNPQNSQEHLEHIKEQITNVLTENTKFRDNQEKLYLTINGDKITVYQK